MVKDEESNLEVARGTESAAESEPTEAGVEFLTDEQIMELQRMFDEQEIEAVEPAVIDAEFESLSSETQTEIEKIEVEYNEAINKADAEAAVDRIEQFRVILEKVINAGVEVGGKAIVKGKELGGELLTFLDLDTKEKALEAAIEVVPHVGAVYFVTGYRFKIGADEKVMDIVPVEKINWTDRFIYLFGELLISGHVVRGVKDSIFKKGVKEVAKRAAVETAKRGKDVLVNRAEKGAKKKFGIEEEPEPAE